MHLEPSTHRSPGPGLTPLIDVVFILLVFFMLVTRFTVLEEKPVQIRDTGAGGADSELVQLRVTGTDTVELNGRDYSFSELQGWLDSHQARPTVITAADAVPLQATIRISDTVRAAGYQDLSLGLLE